MNPIPKKVLSPRLPEVSRIAFGSLTVSPMQANLPFEEAASVISHAFDRGINFIDTAQYYENYDIIKRALSLCRSPEDVIVSTKTYAYSRELAIEAVDQARRELDRDVIDIFMLHEQESYNTLKGHREALEYLFECREKGIVRAVGASTHHVSLAYGMMKMMDEGYSFDVIHPLYNMGGIGIADGGENEMAEAVSAIHSRGVGVFGMKALGGGHLSGTPEEAIRFVLGKDFIDSVAVGMQSVDEVEANIRLISDGEFSDEDRKRLSARKRTLHVEDYCEGCGACVKRCASGALRLEEVTDEDNNEFDFVSGFAAESGIRIEKNKMRAVPDDTKCVRCGYCTKVCPVFALKIF